MHDKILSTNEENFVYSEREKMLVTALKQNKKIVAIYNMESGFFEYKSDMCVAFGLNPEENISFYTLMKEEVIATKSLSWLNKFIEKMSLGDNEATEKLLLKEIDGVHRWYNVIFTKIYPKKAVVTFENYKSQHKKEISNAFYVENGKYHFVIGHNIENGKIFSLDGTIGMLLETENFIDKNILSFARERFFHVDDTEKYSNFFDGARLQHMFENGIKADEIELRAVKRNGEICWVNVELLLLHGPYSAEVIAIATFSDITDKKTQHIDLEQKSKIDHLTDTYNQVAFLNKCNEQLAKCNNDDICAFLSIEIRGIGKINEELGSKHSDSILKSIAFTILSTISSEDIVGRTSMTEFGLLLYNVQNTSIINEKIRILSNAISRTVELEYDVFASIGVAIHKKDGETAEILCQNASSTTQNEKEIVQSVIVSHEKRYFDEPKEVSDSGKHVEIRTFGYFDVFVDGVPMSFKSSKAKELLALLVDRRGGFISSNEAITFLYEDDADPKILLARYRKVVMNLNRILEEYDISDIMDIKNNERRIVIEKVDCDFFRFLQGKAHSDQLYKGSYMNNYSWSENTLASLEAGGNFGKSGRF